MFDLIRTEIQHLKYSVMMSISPCSIAPWALEYQES